MKTILSLYRDYINNFEPKPVPLGIKKLTHAIFNLAIKDIESKNEYHDEAVRWVFSNNSNYIFSFLNICQIFDLNPECVRKVIMLKEYGRYQN